MTTTQATANSQKCSCGRDGATFHLCTSADRARAAAARQQVTPATVPAGPASAKLVFRTEWKRCPACGCHANIVAGVGICPTCDGE